MKVHQLIGVFGDENPDAEVYALIDDYDGVLWPIDGAEFECVATVAMANNPTDTLTFGTNQKNPERSRGSHGYPASPCVMSWAVVFIQ